MDAPTTQSMATHSMATQLPTTNPFDDDKLHEECGVFGIYGHDDSSAHVALGLHALQHRGQAAAGVVSFDGERFHSHRGLGRSEEHTSELQSLMRISYAVFCLKK